MAVGLRKDSDAGVRENPVQPKSEGSCVGEREPSFFQPSLVFRGISFNLTLRGFDLLAALRDSKKLIPDGVHPNAEGAKKMANRIREAIAPSGDKQK